MNMDYTKNQVIKSFQLKSDLLHDEETHKILSKIQSLFRKYRMLFMMKRKIEVL